MTASCTLLNFIDSVKPPPSWSEKVETNKVDDSQHMDDRGRTEELQIQTLVMQTMLDTGFGSNLPAAVKYYTYAGPEG